jgi:hypothetical protein
METLRRLLLIVLLTFLVARSTVVAENINSTNYSLIDPDVQAVSGTASSANYQTLVQGGGGVGYGSLSSSLYRFSSGQGYTFMANVPKISCFETTSTSGTTTCSNQNSTNGAVGICGPTGCYDRAYFEIDEQANPVDTTYLLEISPDNFTTIYIVDGTTRTLKLVTNKTINDYLTKSAWESSPWDSTNIVGLTPNTAYSIRARALHGNFTESEAGPSKNTTTATTYAMLDLDIAALLTDENDAPYTYEIGKISPENYAFGDKYIKVDFESNALQGVNLYTTSTYAGLRSNSTLYLLPSAQEDLALATAIDGYGLQAQQAAEETNSLGKVNKTTQYDYAATSVGQLQTAAVHLACVRTVSGGDCSTGTPTWLSNGILMLKLGARASLNAPAKSDYTDSLTFTLSGAW